MADEIAALLETYHASTLWEMADAAGLQVTNSSGRRLRKAEVIAKMEAEYFTWERVQASLARLNDRERAALDRLLLRGGRVPTRSLGRELLRTGLVSEIKQEQVQKSRYGRRREVREYKGNPNRPRSTEFADVIARLTYFGLVFSEGAPLTSGSTPQKLQYHPGKTLIVPEAVRRHLQQPEPIPPERPDWTPDQVRPAQPELLLRDLYLYWDFVRRNEVPLLQSGLVGKRSLRAVNATLLAPDPLLDEAGREDETGWLYLLRLLLEVLGLARRQRGQLRPAGSEGASDGAQIPPFWTWPLGKQARACLEAWEGLGATNKEEKQAMQYGPRWSRARQLLIATLRTLPADTWLEFDDLLERIQDGDVDFLFPDHLAVETYRGNWYYSGSGSYFYGSTRDLLAQFQQVEQNFVSNAVTSVLLALGMVDIGRYRGRWQAFRLTSEGKEILGEQAPPDLYHEETGKIVVQPNFQILAMGPVDLAWLARLDMFAERQQADQGAFAYEVTRTSIYRALKLGMEIAEILGWLRDASDVEVPQNVRRSLEEWGVKYERIVFRSGASLLQAANAGLLGELAEDPELGHHLTRKVSPEVALLKEGRVDPLVAALVDRGLFPAVSGAEPEAADASVVIHPDGRIVPIHGVPSLHLRGRLARLAEEAGDGTWRLTAASVRRAGGSKAKVDRLLAELGKLHRGTLPKELVEQIRAWGGYYGNANAATVTLIEFRDRDALEGLRQHPELKAYLLPFPAGDRALASVPEEKLAEVKEILARLGVSVRDGL